MFSVIAESSIADLFVNGEPHVYVWLQGAAAKQFELAGSEGPSARGQKPDAAPVRTNPINPEGLPNFPRCDHRSD
jgi:hypothetical protein